MNRRLRSLEENIDYTGGGGGGGGGRCGLLGMVLIQN
jgi:hypothetical protein